MPSVPPKEPRSGKLLKNKMKLYHHKTDGGAEYLCSEPTKGTDEGSVKLSKYVVRIDGDIEKDAELWIRD